MLIQIDLETGTMTLARPLEEAVSPAKSPKVSAYISEELKSDLEKLAFVERRSLSQLIGLLLEEAVERAKQAGKIPADE